MNDHALSIARDFAASPDAAESREPGSAARFRDEVLIPALDCAIAAGARLAVSLDGLEDCSWRFLETVFGDPALRSRYCASLLARRLTPTGSDARARTLAADARDLLSGSADRMAA